MSIYKIEGNSDFLPNEKILIGFLSPRIYLFIITIIFLLKFLAEFVPVVPGSR